MKSRGAFGNSSIKSDIEYLLKELKLTKNISTGTLSFSKLVIFVSKNYMYQFFQLRSQRVLRPRKWIESEQEWGRENKSHGDQFERIAREIIGKAEKLKAKHKCGGKKEIILKMLIKNFLLPQTST